MSSRSCVASRWRGLDRPRVTRLVALMLMVSMPACGQGSSRDAPTSVKGNEVAETGDIAHADEVEPDAASPTDPDADDGWVREDNIDPSTLSPVARVLSWMDPDAKAVAILDAEILTLDADSVTAIFALPPRAHDLWATPAELRWSMSVAQLDQLDANLIGPWLVVLPALSNAPYIVRRTKLAPVAVAAALESEFVVGEESGFQSYKPRGAFPYKIVQLERDMLVFIPAGELASGLTPLTAARDIPPTPLREELIAAFEGDPMLRVVLIAGGPMLHLRFDPLVARMRLTARKTEAGGLDVEAAMQLVDESADQVATLLDKDGDATVSDALRALGKEAAFYAEGSSNVQVRFELDTSELRSLEVRP